MHLVQLVSKVILGLQVALAIQAQPAPQARQVQKVVVARLVILVILELQA